MKIKYLVLIIISFFLSIISVHASSITYNLNIDKNLQFKEDIVYKVKNSELDTSENYDFLTSVVNNNIYFDLDKNVKYSKTKSYNNGQYTVHLKNTYSYIFLTNSRILKECFSSYNYDISDENNIKFNTNNQFYCTHRANTISLNITTPLKVTRHNATSVNKNTYTWNKMTSESTIVFNIASEPTESSSAPMDEITEEDTTQTSNDTTENDEKADDNKKENTSKDKKNNYLIIILSVIVIITIVSINIFLKIKGDKVNKL